MDHSGGTVDPHPGLKVLSIITHPSTKERCGSSLISGLASQVSSYPRTRWRRRLGRATETFTLGRRIMSTPQALEKNWYSVLGATPGDDLQELKQKYQRLVLMFHPDKQKPGLSEEEAGLRLQRFINVDQAWKILSNEERRRDFDLQLRAHELKQSWPLDARVTLEDMTWDSENERYSYSCRCGGDFLLEKEDAQADEDAVVCCDTCSLSIEVKRAA